MKHLKQTLFYSIIFAFVLIGTSFMLNETSMNDDVVANDSMATNDTTIMLDESETLTFESYDEFYNTARTAKRNYRSNKRKTKSGIENVTEYFDFKETSETIELEGIIVECDTVGLNFQDTSIEEGTLESPNNRIVFLSSPSSEDYNYVEMWYELYNQTCYAEKMTINGVPAVKNVVEQDDGLVCYQYHWTQDGLDNYLVLYRGIVEAYNEEDFFNIQKLTVPSE